tara:strand:- start:540 stop:749 length:210 start_codon:yes stop_codon:yes gene_type:complete
MEHNDEGLICVTCENTRFDLTSDEPPTCPKCGADPSFVMSVEEFTAQVQEAREYEDDVRETMTKLIMCP